MGPSLDDGLPLGAANLDQEAVAEIGQLEIRTIFEKGSGLGGIAETVGEWLVAVETNQHRMLAAGQIMRVGGGLQEGDIHVEEGGDITGTHPEIDGRRHSPGGRAELVVAVSSHLVCKQGLLLGEHELLDGILRLIGKIG